MKLKKRSIGIALLLMTACMLPLVILAILPSTGSDLVDFSHFTTSEEARDYILTWVTENDTTQDELNEVLEELQLSEDCRDSLGGDLMIVRETRGPDYVVYRGGVVDWFWYHVGRQVIKATYTIRFWFEHSVVVNVDVRYGTTSW
jgi:hypothetical protein